MKNLIIIKNTDWIPRSTRFNSCTHRQTQFCDKPILKNTPINIVMDATGHESEAAFRLYIKANDIEKAKKLLNYADY